MTVTRHCALLYSRDPRVDARLHGVPPCCHLPKVVWSSLTRFPSWCLSARQKFLAVDSTGSVKDTGITHPQQVAHRALPFPTSYPTSSLLGCVTITDCLSSQEYARCFPEVRKVLFIVLNLLPRAKC